ncbi:hypothetical protein B0T19DRAFT_476462 [Cercophora scortea]|uniref:Uncharacterized protein n=1 Tax=Cercophora scortea TaxID=314031 RepID=A0AAE0IE28_9PEZI|nr:hypothetical protein B0T19DRAFT_476462 [Cercophora scortea]
MAANHPNLIVPHLANNPNEDAFPPNAAPSPWAVLSEEDLITAQAILFTLARPDLYDPRQAGNAPDHAVQRYVTRQTFSFESADQLAEVVAIKAEELDSLRSLSDALPGAVDEFRAEYDAIVAKQAEGRVMVALGVLDAIDAAMADSPGERLRRAREELQIASVVMDAVGVFVEAVERTYTRLEATLARSRELKEAMEAVEALAREVEVLEARVEVRRLFSNAVDGAVSSTGVWEQRQAVLVKVRQLMEEYAGEYPDGERGEGEVEEGEELEELEVLREHLQAAYVDLLADVELNEEVVALGLHAG